MMNGVIVTPLKIIPTENGRVLHALKKTDDTFLGFAEAYFSTIDFKAIKGWKKHHEMTANLVVIKGEVRFVIYDEREDSISYNKFEVVKLNNCDAYQRLTIAPGLWFAFQGLDENESIILNLANVIHRSDEVSQRPLPDLPFEWNE